MKELKRLVYRWYETGFEVSTSVTNGEPLPRRGDRVILPLADRPGYGTTGFVSEVVFNYHEGEIELRLVRTLEEVR